MNYPVACPTCQFPYTQEKIEIYKDVLARRILKIREEFDPFEATQNHAEMGDVLDLLNIDNMCCRIHMITFRTKDDVISQLVMDRVPNQEKTKNNKNDENNENNENGK